MNTPVRRFTFKPCRSGDHAYCTKAYFSTDVTGEYKSQEVRIVCTCHCHTQADLFNGPVQSRQQSLF
jgi:hypothetical protein